MNIRVVVVYFGWLIFCFLLHSTYGGFGIFSGFAEGLVGIGLASIFRTPQNSNRTIQGKK